MIQIDSSSVAQAMTQFEQISLWIHGGTVVVAIVGLKLIFNQLKANVVAVGLDHDRRQKHATAEIWLEHAPAIRERRRKVESALGIAARETLGELHVKRINQEPALREEVIAFLNILEGIATGVNSGVYDVHYIHRLARTYLRGIYRQFKLLIEMRQEEVPSILSEFRAMCDQFHALDQELPHPSSEVTEPQQ